MKFSLQLIKVAFDEEVSQESIETMRKLINRLRHPPTIHQLFAFVGHSHVPQTPSRQQKDKPGYGTLRFVSNKHFTYREAFFHTVHFRSEDFSITKESKAVRLSFIMK